MFTFLTGEAGTGKTTKVKEIIKQSKPGSCILTATTGIAAINLGEGCRTINSVLKFFDSAQLEEKFKKKQLHKTFRKLHKHGMRKFFIDEVSMLDARQAEVLINTIKEVNLDIEEGEEIELIFVGDFCQLPPVATEKDGSPLFAFKSKAWKEVFSHGGIGKVEKLTKVWRQDNPDFLATINAARRGQEDKAGEGLFTLLRDTVDLADSVNVWDYDGVTIVSKNKQVDQINETRLKQLLDQGKEKIELTNTRWGKQLGEWKNIPETLTLAVNARVMILANKGLEYANGSLGTTVRTVLNDTGTRIIGVVTNLSNIGGNTNSQSTVVIKRRILSNYQEELEGQTEPNIPSDKGLTEEEYQAELLRLTLEYKAMVGPGKPYYNFTEQKWVVGEVIYWPLRLAYASTVHKTQGLSLDKVQIDFSDPFFGAPSMMYVALSRVRKPEGLRIVGNRDMFEARCNISEEILEWI